MTYETCDDCGGTLYCDDLDNGCDRCGWCFALEKGYIEEAPESPGQPP